MTEYTAHAFNSRGRNLGMTEIFETREAALTDAFERWPEAARVSVGYGYHGSFNIQSVGRKDWQT